MSQAKSGDKVRVHYTGTLGSGTVFDTSREKDRDPLEFVLGSGQVIPGFDSGVTGMAVGENKKIVISPDDAYGQRRDDLMLSVARTELPEDFVPSVGEILEMQQEDDAHRVRVTITAFDDETVTLDANHPLAGEELTFELELVEIV